MKHKILVVDDHIDIRRLIGLILETREDMDVHQAISGDEAWAVLPSLQPELLVMDVMMPGNLSGYDVCAKIKGDAALRDRVKVILLTARGQKEDRERGLSVGCDAYMTKPFGVMDLIDTIDRVLAAAPSGSGASGTPAA